MSSPLSIQNLSVRTLDVAMREPFGIATGAQSVARNLLVHVSLTSGAQGWGEAAPFPAVNGETQESSRKSIDSVISDLLGYDARSWRELSTWLRARIPNAPSARCAIETAVLDAMARHYDLPLRIFFGGSESSLESDMTITTGGIEAARSAARRVIAEGYRTLKIKVGSVPVASDVQRVLAVVHEGPSCGIILDANGAMESVDDAILLVQEIQKSGGKVVLFEQPMHASDWAGMREVTKRVGVPVAADESVSSVEDVIRVVHERAASVVNLKIMKSGVIEALHMATVARAHGLDLMIGGMVETELAMSMSASLAAGLGGFSFVDLDTPAWLLDSPIAAGYTQKAARIELGDTMSGHGARPR